MYVPVEKAKAHLKKHKKFYMGIGAGFAIGSLVLRSPSVSGTQKAFGFFISQNLEQTTVLARRGHPGNIIKCNETGELFASQNRAARMLDLNPGHLAQHLQGKAPHVKGFTFEKLGEAE